MTAIGTKFAPPYSILFMVELKEKILSKIEFNSVVGVYWWYIFPLGACRRKTNINKMHPIIKFTGYWSNVSIISLHATVSTKKGIIQTDPDLHTKSTES